MKDLFVPHRQSLQLRELGFDEPCFGYFVDGELRGINLGIEELGGIEPYYQRFGFHTLSNHNIDNPNKIVVTTPTFSQAFKFIREKYNLIGLVEGGYDNGKNIFTYVIWEGFKDIITDDYFETLEEAELNCLNELIKMVKENGK